ncbi:hypothetical protein [Bradyrhizobium sp. Ai1a-2]|uniref:hypothetical protein n=1 Tax=Bradyrhizobium sp. Ai1a-2 TaxID=196490 RepID=UPI0004047696|nr:hypothetical protein [Bradyrhizobium sp. Ai1a-2]
MKVDEVKTVGELIGLLVERGLRADEAYEAVTLAMKFGVQGKALKAAKAQTTTPTGRPKKVKTTWPERFSLESEMIEFAMVRNFTHADISRMWERFRDRNISRGEQYADWKAAWRTWVNNQVEFRSRDARPSTPTEFDRRL